MDDQKPISSRDLLKEKKKIKKLIRIKRQEIIQLERLYREASKKMKIAKSIDHGDTSIIILEDQKKRFNKRALINVLKELYSGTGNDKS